MSLSKVPSKMIERAEALKEDKLLNIAANSTRIEHEKGTSWQTITKSL